MAKHERDTKYKKASIRERQREGVCENGEIEVYRCCREVALTTKRNES
jgi:hypothetical protein